MSRILYYHPQSNFSRKVRILLEEKGLGYELEAINLRDKPDYFLKLSPIGKVPVLQDEDGTVIWDSYLIVEYLEEKYPEPSLIPRDFEGRLPCRKWEKLADNLGDMIIQLWLQGLFNQGKPNLYQMLLQQNIDRQLPIFEAKLSQTQYLLGNEAWSLADIAALCSFGYHDLRLGGSWRGTCPNTAIWFEKLHGIDSVKLTMPPSL